MRIAVYTDPLSPPTGGWPPDPLIPEILQRMVTAHPETEFLLLSTGQGFAINAGNVRQLSLKGSAEGSLFACRLMLRRLSRKLKEQKADMLLSMNGLMPLRTSLPCCLFVPRVPGAQKRGATKGKSPCLQLNSPRFAGSASSVAVTSAWARTALVTGFGVPAEKITVTGRGIGDEFHPLDWEEKEKVKSEYTDGREYFICPGGIREDGQVLALMKAFSILKKRLRSNMVLMLAGEKDPAYRGFAELLRTYHFREDIKITGALNRSEASRLTASAYAMICPASVQEAVLPVLQALKCRVPVLAPAGGVLEEVAGAAGLYFTASDTMDLGNKCCDIYKNETLRAEKTAWCKGQAERYSWEEASRLLWTSVMQAGK